MATSDGCPPLGGATRASASISGLAFATSSSYPAQYRNGLFVADYSRNCIVVLPAAAGGVPSGTAIPFERDAVAPVTLTTDPNGNIVYGDFTQRHDPPDPLPAADRVVHRHAVVRHRAAARRLRRLRLVRPGDDHRRTTGTSATAPATAAASRRATPTPPGRTPPG